MGNFVGHAGPGTAFLLVALPMFFRALNLFIFTNGRSFKKGTSTELKSCSNVKPIPIFPSMRISRFWLFYDPMVYIVSGIVAFTGEYIDMAFISHSSHSHLDHLRINVLVILIGIFYLLNMIKVLPDPGWGLVAPLNFFMIGLLLNAHEQPTELRVFSHQVSAYLFFLSAVARFVNLMIGLHANPEYHEKVNRIEQLSGSKNEGRFLSRWWKGSGWRKDVVLGIHPMYTNPAIYATVFPLVDALVLIINGVWWWQMAFKFYVGHVMMEHEKGHHGIMTGYAMLFETVVGVVVVTALIYVACKAIFRKNNIEEENSNLLIDEESGLEMQPSQRDS